MLTDEQLSGMKVVKHGPHIYYGDCSETVFMTSRAGTTQYDRTLMEGFVRPGKGLENWVSRANFALRGILRTGPTGISFYVNRHYAQASWHIRRCTLRLDSPR